MVLVANGVVWMDVDPGEGQDRVSWTRNSNSKNNSNNGEIETNNDEIQGRVEELAMAGSLPTFKSMLDSDWYVNQDFQTHPEVRELGFCANPAENSLILRHPLDSSASCSPSQGQPSALDPSQSHLFFPQKSWFASLLDVPGSNPFDNAFDFTSETSFLAHLQPNPGSNLVGFSQNQMGNHEFNLAPDFQLIRPDGASCLESAFNVGGIEKFDGSESNGLFTNRDKLLKPLEVFPSIGSPPSLFQKRAAMRQSSGDKLGNMEIPGIKKNRNIEKGEIEVASIEISGVNYDSEERNVDSKVEDGTNTGGSYSNANCKVACGDQKGGKKKGMPAKNLMAERRRRKKVNDRLFMLRTAVPRISKMDRASILGDAIDYLKELLQRINDLHNELESNPPVPPVAPSTSFHPLTPTPSTLSCRAKEELCPSLFPSPKNQPAKVEVRVREGGAVNIHMFCARRPGLLVSTMSALDNLGLDIQQAVISCFNGFSLDVFRAELCREGQDVLPEQIKAVLLDSAGFHGMV